MCLSISLGFLTHSILAQTTAPATSVTITDRHRLVAQTLLDAMNYRELADRAMYEKLEEGIRVRPNTEPMRDLMYEFARKHLSFEALKSEYVTLFCEEFSEDELDDLIVFYRSPTGKKWAEKSTTLIRRAGEMSQRQHDKHFDKLRTAILERVKAQQDGR